MSSARPRRGGRIAGRALATAVLALLGLPLAGAAPAYAHASMVGSNPEQGAVLDTLPDQVELEFSEPMDPTAYVVVTGPDGSALVVGEPEVDATTVTQAIGDGGDGSYLMAVKAVSRDGHPVTGRVEFVVGEPSEPVATEEPAPESAAETDSPAGSPAGSPGATSGGAATDRDSGTGWRGREPWVWLVGPGFLGVAGALWLAGLLPRAPSRR